MSSSCATRALSLAAFASRVPLTRLVLLAPAPTPGRRLATQAYPTYPLYLACYFPWASLGLPTLQLEVLLPWAALGRAQAHLTHRATDLYRLGSAKVLAKASSSGLQTQLAQFTSHPHITKAQLVYDAHVYPRVITLGHWIAHASHSLAIRYVPSRISFQILPPFPLASLSVQSSVLAIGLVALTWCAPWAALIRSVIWRSAFVRRIVLGLVRLLSGERGPLSAFGRGHESSLDPLTGESIYVSSSSLIPDLALGAKKAKKGGKDDKVVKHEDVVYEFSVYENQRWWMGLDWTSALLPQERPSWADEHHNAVSPPSSFSLPPAKTTITPQETYNKAAVGSTTPSKFTKRTITWKWLDPEWTVAGAGYVGSLAYQPPGASSSPSSAELLARSPTLTSNESESVGSASGAAGSVASSTAGLTTEGGGAAALDVDEEGWTYGDNLWDKMSGKTGRGRYTRRRRWVRRAVLEITVERDVPKAE